MIATKTTPCLQILASIYEYCLLCPSRVIKPRCRRYRLQWLICHVRGEPHCRAIPTWCCRRLCFRTLSWSYLPALNAGTPSLSKDSSDFNLQPSQCLQNFGVKKRDTDYRVILQISWTTFFLWLIWLLHNQLYSSLLLILPSPISVPQKNTPMPETKPFFTWESTKFNFCKICV